MKSVRMPYLVLLAFTFAFAAPHVARAGSCIGTGAATDISEAFSSIVAAGVEACPVDEDDAFLKSVFYQSEPENVEQLYFWTGKVFVKGRVGGGGRASVDAARALLQEAIDLGIAEYSGKQADVAAVAAIYNVDYPGGMQGLRSEADAVVDGIAERVEAIRSAMAFDATCSEAAFNVAIERATGLRLSGVAASLQNADMGRRLKVGYILGYIETLSAGPENSPPAYASYKDVWERMKPLTLVVLQGRVVRKDKKSDCAQCAKAALDVSVAGANEIAGCSAHQAGGDGRFTLRFLTREPGTFNASVAAKAGAASSQTERITAGHMASQSGAARRVEFDLALDVAEEPGAKSGELALLQGLQGKAAAQAANTLGACKDTAKAASEASTSATKREQAVKKAQALLAKAGAGTSLQTVAQSAKGAETAANEASARALKLNKQAQAAVERACDVAAQVRTARDDTARQTLIKSVTADASAAEAAATGASDAYQEILNLKQNVGDAGVPGVDLSSVGTDLVALKGEIAQLDSEIGPLADRVRKGRAAAQGAISAIKDLLKSASSLSGAIQDRAKGSQDASAIADAKSAAEMLGAIQGSLTSVETCTKALPAGDLDATASATVLSGIDALVGKDKPETLMDDAKKAAAAVAGYAEVTQVIADAARSAAEKAQSCRKLAEAVPGSGALDIFGATADAAIANCDFKQAKQAIDAMSAGPDKDAVTQRYEGALSRERAVKGLFEEAKALYRAGDARGARAKLAAARDQTQCDRFKETIDRVDAKIDWRQTNERVGKARSAIDDCRFDEARALISQMAAEGDAEADTIKAELAAAETVEKEADALWKQGEALRQSGRATEAVGAFQRALARAQCGPQRARLSAAISAMQQGSEASSKEKRQKQCEALYNKAIMAEVGVQAAEAAAILGGDQREVKRAYRNAYAVYQQGANACAGTGYETFFLNGMKEARRHIGYW